tara:strand:- start:481 stop:660 length:180 start_codon:yes stop_codon:yes gene_type:complete
MIDLRHPLHQTDGAKKHRTNERVGLSITDFEGHSRIVGFVCDKKNNYLLIKTAKGLLWH